MVITTTFHHKITFTHAWNKFMHSWEQIVCWKLRKEDNIWSSTILLRYRGKMVWRAVFNNFKEDYFYSYLWWLCSVNFLQLYILDVSQSDWNLFVCFLVLFINMTQNNSNYMKKITQLHVISYLIKHSFCVGNKAHCKNSFPVCITSIYFLQN